MATQPRPPLENWFAANAPDAIATPDPADIEQRVISEARSQGVDEHLARAIGKNESSFRPSVTSSVGAQGVMQLMPGTARDMGVSDSMNADENIRGGVRYLKQLQDKYGEDWTKIAQAYHAGPANLDAGKIGPQTKAYVSKVLADRSVFAKQKPKSNWFAENAPDAPDTAPAAENWFAQNAPDAEQPPTDDSGIVEIPGAWPLEKQTGINAPPTGTIPAQPVSSDPDAPQAMPGTEAFGGKLPGVPGVGGARIEPVQGYGSELASKAKDALFGHAIKSLGGATATEVYDSVIEAARQLTEKALGEPSSTTERHLPQVAQTARFGTTVARGVPQIIDFLLTPAGAATAATGSVAPLAIRSAIGAAYSTDIALKAKDAIGQAYADPTPENIGEAVKFSGMAGIPFIRPVLEAGKAAGRTADATIARHNLEAERLVEQERQAGMATVPEFSQRPEALGTEPINVVINGKPAQIIEGTQGTAMVVDTATGKNLNFGKSRDVQTWLQQNGAESAAGPRSAEGLDAQYSHIVQQRGETQSRLQKIANQIEQAGDQEVGPLASEARQLAQDLAVLDVRLSEVQKQRAAIGAPGTRGPGGVVNQAAADLTPGRSFDTPEGKITVTRLTKSGRVVGWIVDPAGRKSPFLRTEAEFRSIVGLPPKAETKKQEEGEQPPPEGVSLGDGFTLLPKEEESASLTDSAEPLVKENTSELGATQAEAEKPAAIGSISDRKLAAAYKAIDTPETREYTPEAIYSEIIRRKLPLDQFPGLFPQPEEAKEAREEVGAAETKPVTEETKPPVTEAKPAQSETSAPRPNPGFDKALDALREHAAERETDAPEVKEPWQMTRAEWMAQRPAGTSPGMHSWEIQKALKEGESVPAEVLADYPALSAQAEKPAPEKPSPRGDMTKKLAEALGEANRLRKELVAGSHLNTGQRRRIRERAEEAEAIAARLEQSLKGLPATGGVAEKPQAVVEKGQKPVTQGPIPSGSWMNEGEIEDAVERHKNHPVLSRATKFLEDFKEETNAHSDGWPYWKLPIHAAGQLMGMIQHPEYASEENFAKALAPIKAFYTRSGNKAGMKFPEIAPAASEAKAPVAETKPTVGEAKASGAGFASRENPRYTREGYPVYSDGKELYSYDRGWHPLEQAAKRTVQSQFMKGELTETPPMEGALVPPEAGGSGKWEVSPLRKAVLDKFAELPSAKAELDREDRKAIYQTAIEEVREASNRLRGLMENQGDRWFPDPNDASLQRLHKAVAAGEEVLQKIQAPHSSSLGTALHAVTQEGKKLIAESQKPGKAAPADIKTGDHVVFDAPQGSQRGYVTSITPNGIYDIRVPPVGANAARSVLASREQIWKVNGEQVPAPTESTTAAAEKPAEKAPVESTPEQPKGAVALAEAVYQKLKAGESLGNVTEFNKLASKHFGAARTSGEWTPKDAFDAMEAGINKYLLDVGRKFMLDRDVPEGLEFLRNLMDRITSQGVRTEEQIKNQQFSTPPTESYLAAKVANIQPSDVVLEPSAGNGGLAVWPKSIGAEVHVNEISDRRQDMLRMNGFEPTAHDGEIINALLDPSVKPTVVLMNPPFSAGTVKSGPAKNQNKYGFNHVESALQRLVPGGRLVAILGGGQANEPNGGASLQGVESGKWFQELAKRYNIRANVRISGKEYQKYGTNFATRLIVIDKDGPTKALQNVVGGNVNTLEEAYNLLKDVALSRPDAQVPARAGHQPGAGKGQPGTGVAPGANARPASDRGVRPNQPGNRQADELESPAGVAVRDSGANEPGAGDERAGVLESGSKPEGREQRPADQRSEGDTENVAQKRPDAIPETRPSLEIELASEAPPEEDSVAYVTYRPSLKGGKHPGDIVETKTMATVPMPEVTYRPDLPESVLNGGLSAVQLEAVAIAGQQNDIVLPGGFRGSALVGDGTGVGKGRISAGILLDNYRRGRKRLVWVSEKWDLMQDAMRDLSGIGATPLLRGITQQEGKFVLGANAAVTPFKKYNASAKIDHDGVLFSTYALIRSEDKNGNRRVAQLEQYLRGDDGGEGAYIVFDEAHNLKNAVASQGGQVSQIGRAVKELLERIPNLRTVSLSATAATDVVNLGYLDRLGLWGAGTPFPNGFGEFQTQVAPGGVAAMELIARELKAQGKYLSRTLSFKGVEYSEAEHKLNDDQKALYRTAANAWASVLQSAEATIANTTNGGGRQKGRFLAQFYGAQLRFFGVLISSLKIPTAVDLANKALADGKSVVITLVNTNEAAQNREKTKATNENEQDEPPDYDFGPKEMLKELVKNNYPVQQFRDDVDSSGAPIKVPVYRTDADGREVPVNNPEAEAARDALVKKIDRELHMPENPLDSLIQALGGDKKVAELTGRKEKYDRTLEKFVPRGDPSAKRDEVNIFEMRAFQSGKKRVAILSSAAGTGISLHAGKDVRNQQKRYHMTLQVGWSADKAMQMFGRTHRTNQVHAPQYVMLVSDLGGERRFVSTIARRLGSLGALTKGQKNATTGTDLMEKVNFETDQGKKATRSFYQGLEQNQPIPGTGLTGHQILADLHVQKTTRDGGMDIPQADRTNVTKLLNRLLALDPDIQQGAYNYFYDIFEAAVKSAIEEGTLDTGVRTLPGDEFSLGKTETLAKDKSTGAETFYYPVAAKVRTERMKPADMAYRLKTDGELHIGKGDRLVLSVPANAIVHDDGKVELAVYVATASHGNWRRVAATTLRNSPTVDKWAEEQLDKAKEEQRSKKQNIKYYEDEVKRAESAGRTLSDDQFPKSALIARRAELELAEANLVTAKRIADDPEEWATGLWEEQYKAAPSHEVEEHHLIGGAVMRFWNPIKDATFVRDSIYTAADSKTGQRIVGVDIPAEHIGQLLQRIKGGASTVSTDQLYADVLRNNLTYTLEGGTQVRRGRVGREFVVQLIPGTADIAANLKRLGVLYEKGITPIYYLPEKKAQAILGAVTKAYPIQPDQDQQPEGPLRAALGKPRSSSGVAPSHQILPRAIYRKGVLWTNSETMNMLADLAGGGRSTSYHGFYLPAMGAQKLLNKLNALPSASPIRQAIFDVLAGPLKKAVREAISRNGGLIVVTYDKGDPLDNLKTTLRHEKFHEVTKEMGGYARGGILLTHPLAQKAAANLGKKGYESKDAAEMFSEIGAHLASGPVGWKEMGLDRAQAKVLFQRYLELLDKSTIAKMRSIAPQLREVIYGYNAQADLRADGTSAARDFEGLARERDIRRGVREDVPGDRLQGNRKSEREEDQLSRPRIEAARTSTGKITLGADVKALGQVLGSSLYSGKEVHIVTKELLQNAMDAVRGADKPAVSVDIDQRNRTITVSDNGAGMTADEVATVFTDLGASGKREQAEASGGFGLAKAAPLMMSRTIRVETVTQSGAQKIRTILEATPEELLGSGAEMKSVSVSPKTPTGTTIVATMPESAKGWWEAQKFIDNFRKSVRLPGELHDHYNRSQPPARPEMRRIGGISTPAAKIEILATPERKGLTAHLGALMVEINNNGIYQFDLPVYLGGAMSLKDVPATLAADIRSLVAEGHADYPFTANREQLRGDTHTKIEQWITKEIVMPAIEAATEFIHNKYASLPTMNGTKYAIPIFDSGSRFTSEELAEMQSDPALLRIGSLASEIVARSLATIAKSATLSLAPSLKDLGAGIERVGLVFSPELHGVYIAGKQNKATVFVNPFSYSVSATPTEAASLLWHTIKHEILHDKIKGHSQSFTTGEVAVSQALGALELESLLRFREAYAESGNPERFNPDLDRPLQIYRGSRGRPERETDPFRGEASRRRDTRPRGIEGDARSVQPSREEPVSRAGELAERLKRLPGEESGQIQFTTLGNKLTQIFGDEDAPRVGYSALGATKRLFLPGRNLAEVEEASRPVFEAALPAASADALASTTLQSVTPAIMRTLSGSGFTFPELRLYYVESRLRGVRDRWERFSQEADDMSPEQMESNMEALPDGSPSPYLDLLDKVEGRHGMAQNLSQTAVALAQQEDWDTLKTFLAIAFEDAADRVATVMPADQFDAIHGAVRTNPKVREADRLYGEIEKVMADAHAVNEGIFSTDLGPSGRYYPLIPTNIEQKSQPGRRLPYHKPRNTANAFATGLSEDYDTGMEAFSKKLSSGVRSNYKANLIESMRRQGWLIPESQAFRNAEGKFVMTGPDGVDYVATREETKQARTIMKDGKVIHMPARFGVMPAFMNAGLRATLDREPMDPNAVINAMRWANMLATKGPLELAYHSAGVLGALYANTPFLGGSGLDKALSLPLMKWFSIRGKLLNIDPTQPENIEKLREMAKAGALPAKSGKITYSKEYAEMTGAERERFSFGPMLYGPKGIDARARILMYDIFKAAYPNGTTSEMHHFVNQIGNYTPELQGVIERGLKQIGLGPFATAGMTRIVNAVQTFTGGGPGKGGTLESKIWWWLTSSAIIGLAAWIIAHKALTGKWPTQRKQSALMDIAVVPGGGGYIDKARYSKWGKAMWGSGPEVGHLKFSFFDNPLVLRGAHAMGLAGAYQTKQLGGSPGQIMEAAELDITNSLAHPAMGPAARAAFVLKTGEKPYLTGMHDRGRVALRMFPAIPPKTKPGLPSVGARAWAGMKELNSFYTDAAENLAGMTGFADPNEHSKGSFWMKLPFTIFAPGLVGEANSPYKKAEMLRQERAAH